jgi:hypothetical protein
MRVLPAKIEGKFKQEMDAPPVKIEEKLDVFLVNDTNSVYSGL